MNGSNHTNIDDLTVRFKKNNQQKSIETAVVEAVDECINEGILADFFESNRSEVIRMSIYEYDEEGTIQVHKIYNAVISCAPDYDEVKILNTVSAN